MTIEIYIDFDENDNATLTLNLPIEFVEINYDLYFELSNEPFYTECGLKLDIKNLEKKLNVFLEEIKKNFTNPNSFDNTFFISFSVNDEHQKKTL